MRSTLMDLIHKYFSEIVATEFFKVFIATYANNIFNKQIKITIRSFCRDAYWFCFFIMLLIFKKKEFLFSSSFLVRIMNFLNIHQWFQISFWSIAREKKSLVVRSKGIIPGLLIAMFSPKWNSHFGEYIYNKDIF